MKMVKNQHVVKLFEVLASRSKIFIVLELITGGELFDKIVAEGRFDEDTARFYFRQLVNGVKYCHSKGVCHRDLKPENLLLDDTGLLKISDFGLSALYTGAADDVSRATLLHTTCGTPNYVAPEVLADKGYDGRAADVWSMGVILYVLLAGYLPFDEPHMSALFRKIQTAEFEYPSWFSPEIKTLIGKILVCDPAKRLTLDAIEADPWFTRGGYIAPMLTTDAEPATVTPGEAEAATAAAAVAAAAVSAAATAAAASAPASAAPAGAGGPSAPESLVQVGVAKAVEEAVTTPATHTAAIPRPGSRLTHPAELLAALGTVPLGLPVDGVKPEGEAPMTSRVPNRDAASMFTSLAAPSDILARMAAALVAMDPECEVKLDASKFKATTKTPKGEISLVVNVYGLSESMHFVEMHRGKGDILEYARIYNEVRSAVTDLVHSTCALPTAATAAGGSSASIKTTHSMRVALASAGPLLAPAMPTSGSTAAGN